MKKFVIIILLILPIFLMVTISLVGQMLATITYINVESVAFVDELENDVESIKIGKGQKERLQVLVLPQLANNKSLKFTSKDTNYVEVDNKGYVTGIDYGSAEIVVESVEGKKTDVVRVYVADDKVSSVDVIDSEKQLNLYEEYKMKYKIFPDTALDKKVYWSSNNSEYVEVNRDTGVVVAKKVTEPGMTVTITATTRDGSFVDSCEVIVVPYVVRFIPQLTDPSMTVYEHNELTLDLMSFIVYDTTRIAVEDIHFYTDMGQQYATITDNILTFDVNKPGVPIIRLVCKVLNDEIGAEFKIMIVYNNQ